MYHKLWRLRDKVDYVITDSPLPFCYYYDRENIPHFKELVMEAFNTFDNVNFVLHRNFPYQQEGRYQNEEEADKVNDEILEMMKLNNIKVDREISNPWVSSEEAIISYLEVKNII